MQLATAREAVLATSASEPMAATILSWTRSLLIFTACTTVVSVWLRHPIASAVGERQDWGCCTVYSGGCLGLLLARFQGLGLSNATVTYMAMANCCRG